MSALRVLDVGCHDGFLGVWLQAQIDVELYGLELNSDACARARKRGYVRVECAAAEDAPLLFEPGSFDVVAAMEVLEHVPDMPAFLTALEAMVKPGGRVVLSTPDGCFGEGRNPHHLRALRSIDLADLLRRRGRLLNMLQGSDGVTVGSYTPRPRRDDIAIYTGPSWQRWAPQDIQRKGLGGSETWAVRLAESLSELGFVVTVYGDVEQGAYKDVIFRHHETFDSLEPRGGLIASRIPEVGDRPMVARTKLLWAHDIEFGPRLTPARAGAFDAIVGLSDWHVEHLKGRYPFAAGRVIRSRNGIHLPYFDPQPWAQRANRVLYTSSPDRGLDILLEEWPRILDQAPDAELCFCYPDVYDAVAEQDGAVGEHRAQIRRLADQPGVTRLGSLPQHELAQLMCSSRVWTHPSWASMQGCAFHETSCIGAMEAQAAGCHVVASDWGALRETVRYGRLVNSDPPNARWRDALVKHIVEGLNLPDVGNAAVQHGPPAVADMGWAGVAEQVAKLVAAGDRDQRPLASA